MRQILVILVFIAVCAITSVAAQTEYCFKNEGLKGEATISSTLSGNKITDGEYESASYDSNTSAETYHFTGTKTGNTLTIKYARAIPAEFANIRKFTWTLGRSSLKVRLSGKNCNTNKWGVCAAAFDKCAS